MQVLLGTVLIDALKSTLEDAVEAFQRIRIGIAPNVFFGAVIESLVSNEAKEIAGRVAGYEEVAMGHVCEVNAWGFACRCVTGEPPPRNRAERRAAMKKRRLDAKIK